MHTPSIHNSEWSLPVHCKPDSHESPTTILPMKKGHTIACKQWMYFLNMINNIFLMLTKMVWLTNLIKNKVSYMLKDLQLNFNVAD